MTFRRTPTREPPAPKPHTDTKVIRLVTEQYRMSEGEIADLASKLEQQMTREYLAEVQRQLKLHGCQRLSTGPDSKSQKWLMGKAQQDAGRIAKTYEREMGSRVQKLFDANKRGNRFYYFKGLNAWNTERNTWKLPQISLATAVKARDYAAQRFRRENGIEGVFIFVGPAPVCDICIGLKALGVVSAKEGPEKYGDSQHLGCNHFWTEVIPKQFDDCSEIWTG